MLQETHWHLSITQPDPEHTRWECECGASGVVEHLPWPREQAGGARIARLQWWDHVWVGLANVPSEVTL